MPLHSKPFAELSLCTKHGANHTTVFLEVHIIISRNGCHWRPAQIPFTAIHPFPGCPEKWLINHLLPHPWGSEGVASLGQWKPPPHPDLGQCLTDPGGTKGQLLYLKAGLTDVIYVSGFPCLAFSCPVLLHSPHSLENTLSILCLNRSLQLKFYS